MEKVVVFGLFLLLVFLSLVPRSAELSGKNYLFGFDQGRDYLEVKKIVVDKKLTFIGSEIGAGSAGFKGVFHGPFHYYFLSLPFIIFNGDPYGGIVLTFFYGIVSIFLGFYLGKKIFGKYSGLIIGILIAVSPPLISASRFVWNTHGASVFILLAFYLVYRLTQRITYSNIFLAAFFSSFIYNFQLAIAIPMSVSLIVFLVFILHLKKLKLYLFLFMGFVTGFLPAILFEIRHNFMALRGIFTYILENNHQENFYSFFALMKDHLGTFFYNFLDTFPRFPIITSEIAIFFVLFFTFYFLLKEKNAELKKFFVYIFILPFITFLVLLFLNNAVYVYYLLHLNFVYILFFTYILYSSLKNKNFFLQAGLVIIFAIFAIKGVVLGIEVFKYDIKDYGGTAKIKGKLAAVDFIYNDAKGKPFGLLVFTPPVYTYAYDYLIWWYGERKYNYKPYEEKKGTFYLLMETDPQKPWSYKGWLETVIKNGDIVYTKTLPSGLMVQKRFVGNKNE